MITICMLFSSEKERDEVEKFHGSHGGIEQKTGRKKIIRHSMCVCIFILLLQLGTLVI